MQAVSRVIGRVAPYRRDNVDTDEIVPARYLYKDRKDGFAETLFHDLRFDETGAERPDFILTQAPYRNPVILVAGQNFGCGSSREQAVWALYDFGVRAVIAVSFGDIFCNNAVENALLPVVLPKSDIQDLQARIESTAPCDLTIDLPAQEVRMPDGHSYTFDIDESTKNKLLDGRSAIDTTLLNVAEIMEFETRYSAENPWIEL